MNSIELDIMRGMVNILNTASDTYYNSGNPIMTDAEFDMRLKDLKEFEEETGFVLANSPTQCVGYKVLTELKEITHNHPMLSLDKVHSVEELLKFINNKDTVASIKLDGLTVSLKYENGVLISGETRGDGYVGSDITEHIKQFINVPSKINKEGVYVVDCEAIITDEVVAIGDACGLPYVLTHKIPSDGLCDKTDEDNIGFTYEVLNRYIRTGEIEDEDIKNKIDTMHRNNLFKMKLMPKFPYKPE